MEPKISCTSCRGFLTNDCTPGDAMCSRIQRELEQMALDYPCVGCGYCCKFTTCWEGQRITSSPEGPCPLLVYDGYAGRYWCGLVLHARGEELKCRVESLHIGAGCCSSMNSLRQKKLVEMCLQSGSIFDTGSFSKPFEPQ